MADEWMDAATGSVDVVRASADGVQGLLGVRPARQTQKELRAEASLHAAGNLLMPFPGPGIVCVEPVIMESLTMGSIWFLRQLRKRASRIAR